MFTAWGQSTITNTNNCLNNTAEILSYCDCMCVCFLENTMSVSKRLTNLFWACKQAMRKSFRHIITFFQKGFWEIHSVTIEKRESDKAQVGGFYQ